MQQIQVGIADDHGIVRSGLRHLINEELDMHVIGETADGHGACRMVRDHLVDVLVLDVAMPHMGGMEAAEQMRKRSSPTAILMLTESPANRFAVKAFAIGVKGWLGKDCDPPDILAAIRTLSLGKRHITAEVSDLMADSVAGIAPPRALHDGLATREFELLMRFARGETSAGIGNDLSISSRTVSTYHGTIMKKLGVHSSAELTRYALNWSLID